MLGRRSMSRTRPSRRPRPARPERSVGAGQERRSGRRHASLRAAAIPPSSTYASWPSWRSHCATTGARTSSSSASTSRAPRDAHPLVGRLDQLAARRMREARHGARRELLRRAHVEQIGRARGVGEPAR